jgi:outer membrane protein assembly factor BamB
MFEGPPVAEGARVYVAQRRRGATTRTRVVCYDAENGRELWQRFICAADTPGSTGPHQTSECTHNLLTLHQGTVYYNTNLGAVAALDAQDGVIQWLTAYKRARPESSSAPAFLYRDLNPCLYHNGMLYVAPSDFDGILCIRAATGQIMTAELRDSAGLGASTKKGLTAVHLLGVVGKYLIASGDMLWWIDVEHAVQGKTEVVGEVNLHEAYGRGVIVGETIHVPLRERIQNFTAEIPEQKAPHSIALSALHPGVTGGHLIVCDTHLLVVGAEAIYGFELSRPLSSYRPRPAKAARAADGSQ